MRSYSTFRMLVTYLYFHSCFIGFEVEYTKRKAKWSRCATQGTRKEARDQEWWFLGSRLIVLPIKRSIQYKGKNQEFLDRSKKCGSTILPWIDQSTSGSIAPTSQKFMDRSCKTQINRSKADRSIPTWIDRSDLQQPLSHTKMTFNQLWFFFLNTSFQPFLGNFWYF